MPSLRAIIPPTLLLLLPAVCAQLQVTTPEVLEAELGSSATLPCRFSLGVAPVDPAQVHVVWKHDGRKVLSYVDVVTAFRPGARISEERLAQGDASLTLPNISSEDAGTYACNIRLASEQALHSTNLSVRDQRSIWVDGTTVLAGRCNELHCTAANLSSPEVTVEWRRNGELLSSSGAELLPDSDTQHYKIQSSICLYPSSSDDGIPYTCQVTQRDSPHPLRTTFLLTFGVRPVVTFYLSSTGQKNSSLVCRASGFYPANLSLEMMRDGWPLRYRFKKWENPNGTYTLEATYLTNVTYQDSNTDFTCTAFHPTTPEGETERLKFLVEAYVPKWLWIAGASGLLVAFALQIFCKHVTDISGCKDWTEGSMAVLRCSITGRYPRNLTAVWVIRQGEKEVVVKERGSLYMAGDYRELQEQDGYTCWNVLKSKMVGGIRRSLCSILCFQVEKARHNQAEFICRFMRADKVLQEKKYFGIVLDNFGFYWVSEICIPESCSEGEVLTLSCTMRGNVPRGIRVTWERGHDDEHTTISKEQHPGHQVTENQSPGQISTFLTFCPTWEDHEATFTCSFTDNEGRMLAERSSKPLKIAEPKKNNWSRTYQDWGFRVYDNSAVTEM